jgi:hypothetical protein
MRKRVKISYAPDRGYFVDLPSYSMVRGSLRPVIAGKTTVEGVLADTDPADPALAALTCEVDFPDDYADEKTGAISPARIREIYKDNPRWTDPAKPPDV